jgi:hypothetical protein
MDDHTDDRDPGLPPVGTPEELEEALKWLEDLTARQGKPADLTNPVPAASLDSPFRGLIDSEDGDLPDWLREVPTPPGEASFEDSEPESRLDWLAKMAQRESIEELPTLEWRRLSEPAQSAILGTQTIEVPAAEQDSDDQDQPGTEPVSNSKIETEATGDEERLADLVEEVETETSQVELDELVDEPTPDQDIIIGSVEEFAETELADDEIVALQDEFEIRGQDETVESGQHETAGSEYDQPLDDLDAAMAWLEELAASQDAPIEDVPSVADRALASKLMMEAGLSPTVSPLDELGSDSSLDSITPTHPFIEEEDFADTVVLVETLAADQGTSTIVPVEPEVAVVYPEAMPAAFDEPDFTSDTGDYGDMPDLVQSPEELSFEEAMAFLDEIAGSQADNPVAEPDAEGVAEMMAAVDSVDEIEPALIPEDAPDLPHMPEAMNMEILPSDSLSAEDVPWLDSSPEALVVEPVEEYIKQEEVAQPMVEGLNGTGYSDWEATLLDLDALALPPGKTLDDISASLRTAQVSPWRDVGSALAWLEETLSREVTVAPIELDDAELVDLMPEDPDAVLAWLEQMAAEEEIRLDSAPALRDEPSGVITSPQQAEPLLEELVEADLLNMPEDPDEAMAWLEGLARGNQQPSIDTPSVAYSPDEYLTEFDAPGGAIAEEIESAYSEVEAAIAPDVIPSADRATEWIEPADEVSLPDLLPFASAEVDIERAEDTGGFDSAPVDDIDKIFDEVIVELETTLIDEAASPEHVDVAMPAETSGQTPEVEIIIIPPLDVDSEASPVEPILLVMTEEAAADAEAGEMDRHDTRTDAEVPAIKPGRKRSRAKITAVEEEPQMGEPSAPAAPEAKPPVPSWIDLLKPLD